MSRKDSKWLLACLVAVLLLAAVLPASQAAKKDKVLKDKHDPECRICHGIVRVAYAMMRTYNSSVNVVATLAREGCKMMESKKYRERCLLTVDKVQCTNRDMVKTVVCHMADFCEDTGYCHDDDDAFSSRNSRNSRNVGKKSRGGRTLAGSAAQCDTDDQPVCNDAWRDSGLSDRG